MAVAPTPACSPANDACLSLLRTGQFTHLQEIMQRPLPRTWDVVFDSETQEDKLVAQVGCCQELCCNVLLVCRWGYSRSVSALC